MSDVTMTKWVARGPVVYTEETGLKVAQVDDNWPEEVARELAVLPEALEVLVKLNVREILGGSFAEHVRDILRRAGRET